MTRAERSESRLFPSGEDTVFAGVTKDLSVEQSHQIGSKILAGKFVTPTEEEGKFRYEIGRANPVGVEYIGAGTATADNLRFVSVTPHASTQEGDLMVLVVNASTNDSSGMPDQLAPAGWQKVAEWDSSASSFPQFGGIYVRRREAGDTGAIKVYSASEFIPLRWFSVACLTFRNARLMGEEDIKMLQSTTLTATAIPFGAGEFEDVPRGSYVVTAATAWDSATGTISPSSGFTEVFDDVRSHSGASFTTLETAIKQVTQEGHVSVGDATYSGTGNYQISESLALVVEPKQLGLVGWTGEAGTETIEFNEQGKARFKEFVGDLKIRGSVSYQKPFVLICKNSDQTLSGGTATTVTFSAPSIDDLGIYDDATDAMVFTHPEHRGIWKITARVKWDFSGAGRRLLELLYNGNLATAHNVQPVSNAGSTWNQIDYYLVCIEDATLTLQATQNSGGSLAIEGEGSQRETSWTAEYIRDLD